MGTLTQSKRQLAWVFDLNKCIGCQTCSVACKVLWPGEDRGTESMWWMTVNTQPGRGMPRDWEAMGGGYVGGRLKLGRRPTADEIGGGWDFNYDEVRSISYPDSVSATKVLVNSRFSIAGDLCVLIESKPFLCSVFGSHQKYTVSLLDRKQTFKSDI